MTTPFNNENQIYPVESPEGVFDLPGTDFMHSTFDEEKNITIQLFEHLLEGKAIVDLSDGEYIHWLQLNDETIRYFRTNYQKNQI